MGKSGQEKAGKGPGIGSRGRGYTVSPSIRDALWKDMFQHEKYLQHVWHWKWDSLLEPEYWPPFKRNAINHTPEEDKETKTLKLQPHLKRSPPPPLPNKSSGTIGWISAKKENSFDIFLTKPTRPPKIRFKDEQYGFYRLKRFSEEMKQPIPEPSMPTSRIIHNINPILC